MEHRVLVDENLTSNFSNCPYRDGTECYGSTLSGTSHTGPEEVDVYILKFEAYVSVTQVKR